MSRNDEINQAYFNRTGKWPVNSSPEAIYERKREKRISKKRSRGPAISEQRKLEIIEAARKLAELDKKPFFYIHIRCSKGHYSRRSTNTGQCLKCM